MDIRIIRELEQWAKELNEVFTLPDLKVALREKSQATLFRKIKELVSCGELIKVKRGLYASSKASLEVISSRIERNAYISTGTILAKNAIIGSVPGYKVQAVKVGSPRNYICELGNIEHFSIEAKHFFGYSEVNGVLRATAEKAFIDVWYYIYKGHRFSFNAQTDVNIEYLDKKLINTYLEKYDKRFITYLKNNMGSI
ncbi:MAG: hypothetical protein HQL32_06700 [Planctomycetes bacterium]|nr:hypothetical protein [Planctomycetota bacterium]